MGISSNFKTTREKWEWLDNITGVDTHVFYTFVGGSEYCSLFVALCYWFAFIVFYGKENATLQCTDTA